MLRAARPIRQLTATTIDQIAAGEVVERPASVVKELVENALDSGATQVDVCVEQGGLASIVVADDGCGMSAEDALMAVTRHATSKIAHVDDLQAVATYGFRGEALSSVASISKFVLTTRRPEDTLGFRLELHGGKVVAQGPCGAPPGTTLQISELFYNVPARRKFMRAAATEQAYVQEALLRTFLGARRGALTYTAGKRRLLDVLATCTAAERPAQLLGRRVRQLVPFEAASSEHAVAVAGFLSLPALVRTETCGLWVFVNGRFVRDRMLQRAVLEGYQLAFADKFPTALVYVDLAPACVDVNVHPQKLEVRFDDAHATYKAVRDAVAVAASKLQKSAGKDAVYALPGREQGAPAKRLGTNTDADADAAAQSVRAPNAGLRAVPLPQGASAHWPPGDGPSLRSCVRPAGRLLQPSNVAGVAADAPAAAWQAGEPGQPASGHLPLGLGPWQALIPLGLGPEGYLACQRGAEWVLVHLASAFGLLLQRTLAQPTGPALHRLLLPVQYQAQDHEVALVDDFILANAESPHGSASGLHLQPVAAGQYLVQAIPAPLADCEPLRVVQAYFDAAKTAADAAPSAAAWLQALAGRAAWPRLWGDKARWPHRLFAALDGQKDAVPLAPPCAYVVREVAGVPTFI